MKFPTKDGFRIVPEDQTPNYDSDNPLLRVIREAQLQDLAAEREHYLHESLEHLFPFYELTLYGPGQGPRDIGNPVQQNNKVDFQKQNIADFRMADYHLVRGYASAGEWVGSFVKICYRGTPGTRLGQVSGGSPGAFIQAWVKLGANQTSSYLRLPLNPATGCYEVELWSFNGPNLRQLLEGSSLAAFDAGLIQPRPDLVKGSLADFEGPGVDAMRDRLNRQGQSWQLLDYAPDHCMHPVRPLRIEIAFTNEAGSAWDSNGGANYRVVFGMMMRGWRSFLNCGISANPHGGFGVLEFRNLFSNYFFEQRRREVFGADKLPELGRDLIPGNYHAHTYGTNGTIPAEPVKVPTRETFFAVDYMDLHILQPECSIGIHRHRDNQEAFLMLEGHAHMLVGDWCEFPDRDRAFEIRPMGPGDVALCKTGQLHALYNSTDETCSLFMFGGYD